MIAMVCPSVDDGVVEACLAASVALLAAALIVVSLINLRGNDRSFTFADDEAQDRARRVIDTVRVTSWVSALGVGLGVTALVWPVAPVRWLTVGVTLLSAIAFLVTSERTLALVLDQSARQE